MSRPHVRRANPNDAPRLRDIAQRAYSPYLPQLDGVRPAPLDTDYGQAITNNDVWVIDDDGHVTGFVILARSGDEWLLENVAVDPDAQGQGVGNLLLAVAEDQARAASARRLRLFTNVVMADNQRWYIRHGFREVDRRDDGGYQRIFYEKWLA